MDKDRKLELIQRTLGLKHKLKVHESMKQPDTHDEIAVMMLTRWEYEDELHAIEELLSSVRLENVSEKRKVLENEGAAAVRKKSKKPSSGSPAGSMAGGAAGNSDGSAEH